MSVYFITARDLGLCKIGVAQNVKSRRSSLQTSCPAKLTIEATLPGSYELERELHARFAEHRVNGEWFTITPELDALIAETAGSTVVPLPVKEPKEERESDEERVENSIALHRQILAEAMESFERVGCFPRDDHTESQPRPYEPVAASGGQFGNHFAVRDRETRKTYCSDLRLSWDQADRLCDVFAEISQRAMQGRQVPLDLEQPKRNAA